MVRIRILVAQTAEFGFLVHMITCRGFFLPVAESLNFSEYTETQRNTTKTAEVTQNIQNEAFK